MSSNNLKNTCLHFLTHHKSFTSTPADDFQEMAEWCRDNNIEYDRYGTGELIQAFETKVSKLLGFDAAKFCITGVATQIVALRLACDIKKNNQVLVTANPEAPHCNMLH